jgi:hypothetical protein
MRHKGTIQRVNVSVFTYQLTQREFKYWESRSMWSVRWRARLKIWIRSQAEILSMDFWRMLTPDGEVWESDVSYPSRLLNQAL